MPNEIQIECYFQSTEMAKLCQEGTDIMVNFKASFSADGQTTFTISATSFTDGGDKSASTESRIAASSAPAADGCPKPCLR